MTAEEFKQRVIESIKLWIPSLQTERERELVNGIIGDIEVMDEGGDACAYDDVYSADV